MSKQEYHKGSNPLPCAMKIKPYKKIEFPHIATTINFCDMSKLKGVPIKGSGFTCVDDETNEIYIFIQDIAESVKMIDRTPIIAHELVHALQIIMKRIGSRIEEESESSAYMLTYAMCQVLGVPYFDEKKLKDIQ
jgi:hypothetical protein